ncbi:MAG: hypothetical protein JST16_10600 [Bdellovibrionales bacterium]|nr:hypothetical protein [Bdellovibrionales bacterium]
MTLPMLSGPHSLVDAWEVLVLFLIPVGGGIPAGVVLAQKRGLVWPLMMILYFISDVILACVLEPVLKLLIAAGRNRPWVMRLAEGFKLAVKRSTAHYGTSTGPLALILIAFGVDPMTGRAAAAAAGHGFVTGWLIAITGDMIFFTLLMVSTLWLNSILGDGTLTTIIILAVMIALPALVRRVRARFGRHP